MAQFVVRDADGKLYQVSAEYEEKAYFLFARYRGQPDPIDTGDVDVDLFAIEDLEDGTVVPFDVEEDQE